ncbi:hypothetical protein HYR69_12190 [Candidatus Sumerlaeota bacterium]|nr:hypothetical protein [Candidatus Sumerlaeota bacterium]
MMNSEPHTAENRPTIEPFTFSTVEGDMRHFAAILAVLLLATLIWTDLLFKSPGQNRVWRERRKIN